MMEPRKASFRELVKEVPSSSYITHSIHFYPAAMIPHVARFCIKEFSRSGDWVLDPFAGSGTVGLECFVTGRNATLIDINPMTMHFMEAKLTVPSEDARFEAASLLSETLRYEGPPFQPDWREIEYWHPREVLGFLGKVWGYIHHDCRSRLKPILAFAALGATRLLSYASDDVPKLHVSKKKVAKVKGLIASGAWRKAAWSRLESLMQKYLSAAFDLKRHIRNMHRPTIEVYAPQDIWEWRAERKYDLVVTSPPYMQAQEYIRSSKIDLLWLAYSQREIKQLQRREIPYKPPADRVKHPLIDEFRRKIMMSGRKRLLQIYDSYFYYVLGALEKAAENLRPGGHLCVFTGTPTVLGEEIPIWRIIAEYLEERDFEAADAIKDEIVMRTLFQERNNRNPKGMRSEILLILRKS